MTLLKVNHPTKQFVSPLWNTVLNDLFSDRFTNETTGFIPAVNIAEDNDSYEIHLSAPGFQKENLNISIEKETLSISGEYKSEVSETSTERKFNRKEFNFSSFKRSWTLPENVNADEISANYENGILKVRLPKKSEDKITTVKQINIG